MFLGGFFSRVRFNKLYWSHRKPIMDMGVYWFDIIEQRLSKSPLFSIVYYYCIRTVTVEEMFVRQDHEESINCYMMGIKITVENIGLHMRFDMTAVSKSTGLGIQEI